MTAAERIIAGLAPEIERRALEDQRHVGLQFVAVLGALLAAGMLFWMQGVYWHDPYDLRPIYLGGAAVILGGAAAILARRAVRRKREAAVDGAMSAARGLAEAFCALTPSSPDAEWRRAKALAGTGPLPWDVRVAVQTTFLDRLWATLPEAEHVAWQRAIEAHWGTGRLVAERLVEVHPSAPPTELG